MKTFDTDLLIVEISEAPSGYVALDLLTRNEKIRILEAAVAGGGRFVILAQGESESLKTALGAVQQRFEGFHPERILDSEILENPSNELLESIYALNAIDLAESLLVVGSETVSGLLMAAHEAIEAENLKVIEARIYRGGISGGLALITGSTEACARLAEEVRARFKSSERKGLVEVIDKPNANFRTFFNISGES